MCYNKQLSEGGLIMKIFNIENGVKKVYVQINDIVMLDYINLEVPDLKLKETFTSVVSTDSGMEFLEFTKPDEIEFFKSLDWIIDYKQIRDLTIYEIKEKINEVSNSFNPDFGVEKIRLLKYKMKYLLEMLSIKQGKIKIPFPIVPDSDGFSFTSDDCEYEISSSLDPNKLLLFRKDGKKLSNEDKIPQGFMQAGMSIAIMKRTYKNEVFIDYEMSNSFTCDNKYLVTEFKAKSYDNDDLKKNNKLKKIVKRFFSKN